MSSGGSMAGKLGAHSAISPEILQFQGRFQKPSSLPPVLCPPRRWVRTLSFKCAAKMVLKSALLSWPNLPREKGSAVTQHHLPSVWASQEPGSLVGWALRPQLKDSRRTERQGISEEVAKSLRSKQSQQTKPVLLQPGAEFRPFLDACPLDST